jgi:hypothetical protein
MSAQTSSHKRPSLNAIVLLGLLAVALPSWAQDVIPGYGQLVTVDGST